jgi:hypothetical protein
MLFEGMEVVREVVPVAVAFSAGWLTAGRRTAPAVLGGGVLGVCWPFVTGEVGAGFPAAAESIIIDGGGCILGVLAGRMASQFLSRLRFR